MLYNKLQRLFFIKWVVVVVVLLPFM